jgi:hypothetical protein
VDKAYVEFRLQGSSPGLQQRLITRLQGQEIPLTGRIGISNKMVTMPIIALSILLNVKLAIEYSKKNLLEIFSNP